MAIDRSLSDVEPFGNPRHAHLFISKADGLEHVDRELDRAYRPRCVIVAHAHRNVCDRKTIYAPTERNQVSKGPSCLLFLAVRQARLTARDHGSYFKRKQRFASANSGKGRLDDELA